MRWRDQTGSVRAAAASGPPAARRPGGGRPTIAVLLDNLGTYQSTVLAGIADAARARDVNLAVFAGGVLGGAGTEGQHRNFVFALCGPAAVDGAVLLGGALGNARGPAAVAELCARLAPMPLASLTLGPPDVPRLTLDQDRGLRQAILHLITAHGCRRLAFVRGPALNDEAERRYALYRTVLDEEGLAVDPALICDGTFEKPAGEAAVARLVDERRVAFDALVAANDYMALGALEALEARGLDVPGDVAVVGFDDIEDARFSSPPLTTVRQPLYQQGEAALDRVLAQLEGRPVELDTVHATELVVRRSCGCLTTTTPLGESPPRDPGAARHPRAGGVEALLAQDGDDLREELVRSVHGADTALLAGWEGQLLDAFEAELRGAGAGLFAAALNRLLADVSAAGDDVAAWQRAVSAMRRWLLPALVAEPHRWAHAEDVWHGARIVIADLAERAQAQHRLHAERLARALTASGAALLATQQIGALTGAITRQLPELAIPGAWMALRAAKPGAEDAVEILLAHDHERAPGTAEPAPGTTLAAGGLVPAVLRPLGRRASLVVAPLSFHERAFGYLAMEIGPREGVVYASLAEQVSSALEGARLGARLVEEATRRQVAERERLEKEMEIAARIQTSILPRALAVPGLEIAAAMRTATEVGGDYYDVIPTADGCWLGIGDVAGHGLPTGLVMLMMQSGVGVLARKMPDAPPRELLLALNAMLVENVRDRLGQREHATLTLLRYRQDGSLSFAGAHEEILIRRAATGRCDRLETPGPWVGAKRDITAGTVETTARLAPGDVLVLYTDGLVEAVGHDGRSRFGSDRLITIIERAGAGPAALRDAILAQLDAFAPRLDDDVTLLVARYFLAPGAASLG
ncbi:MAG TPA: SpoIIE family protein phosphatase [Polyangia bacterium]|nr:SpoIIE family protein phosphatase [Polyangia bacterium]